MPVAKKIHVLLDEELARTVRKEPEVQKVGISEFVRRALRFYLSRPERREGDIAEKYQKGYGKAEISELTREMKDWEEEQVWPE